jgi:hypothetical protein
MEKSILEARMKRKGYCVGPHGAPIKDEMAKWVEDQLRIAEKNGGGYVANYKLASETVEFEPGERASIDRVTSAAVDRDSEIIDPRGVDLEAFKKSPDVFWGHNTEALPIGVAGGKGWIKHYSNVTGSSARAEATEIRAKTIFYKQPEDFPPSVAWFPSVVYSMIQQGGLKGRSIGFIANEPARKPRQQDIDKNPSLAGVKGIYRSTHMLEYSVVGIPSNPDALALSVSKGLCALPEWAWKDVGLTAEMVAKAADITEQEAWDDVADGSYLWKWAESVEGSVITPDPKVAVCWDEIGKSLIKAIRKA